MTKDDIIRMALDSYGAMTGTGSILFTLNGSLERFAELLEAKVRADERNALFATAPDLLEVLEAIRRYPKIRAYLGSELTDKADAAISKARGEK